jgi:hypothetical protein
MNNRFPLGTSVALLGRMRLGGVTSSALPGFIGGVTHIDFEVPNWAQFDGPPEEV